MPEVKSKGGRPRKYPKEDKYARQKAYYERKKKKMKELEEKVKALQEGRDLSPEQKKILEDLDILVYEPSSWTKITPNEISLMGSQELEKIIEDFKKIADNNTQLRFHILNLIIKTINIDYLHSSDDLSTKDLLKMLKEDVSSILDAGYESNQQQTLLYLMEAELASKERSSTRERKLDIFEAKVEELEREARVKEKEIKKIEKLTEQ
ncbi:MAG: hypothetical protein KAU62_06205 [Candidatus Heimdallarchaeota archaeon]|nr:hypothetical protein [Candidatus Heimdallarchaeota archaeon]MCG3255659.1 hypothetical protein [Candidatus Heimdallarchaeota archaeon]MCK4610734.1 hypothetical protein [Candidatus Heimdallarchaeota archaeon]